eukprot:1389769-Prymnesium_polylepis.1
MSDVVARQQVRGGCCGTDGGGAAGKCSGPCLRVARRLPPAVRNASRRRSEGATRKWKSAARRSMWRRAGVSCEPTSLRKISCAAAAVGGAGWPARWKGAVRQRVSLLVQGNSELPFTAEGAAALLAAAVARAAAGGRALLRAAPMAAPQVEGWVELLKRVDDGSSAFATYVYIYQGEIVSIGCGRDQGKTLSTVTVELEIRVKRYRPVTVEIRAKRYRSVTVELRAGRSRSVA